MASLRAYIFGFLGSIGLTLTAYFLVSAHVGSGHEIFSHGALLFWILALAVIQLMVQLLLFLHLGREQKPRWNLLTFASALSLILIVVLGSIWIMAHLNYNMTPQQVHDYIFQSDAF